MATTKIVSVTKDWTKIADGSCVLQAKSVGIDYQVYVGATAPTPTDSAYHTCTLKEAVVFDFNTPVFCRIPANMGDMTVDMVVTA